MVTRSKDGDREFAGFADGRSPDSFADCFLDASKWSRSSGGGGGTDQEEVVEGAEEAAEEEDAASSSSTASSSSSKKRKTDDAVEEASPDDARLVHQYEQAVAAALCAAANGVRVPGALVDDAVHGERRERWYQQHDVRAGPQTAACAEACGARAMRAA